MVLLLAPKSLATLPEMERNLEKAPVLCIARCISNNCFAVAVRTATCACGCDLGIAVRPGDCSATWGRTATWGSHCDLGSTGYVELLHAKPFEASCERFWTLAIDATILKNNRIYALTTFGLSNCGCDRAWFGPALHIMGVHTHAVPAVFCLTS